MYFDDAEGPVFRPPSEANSFILRVTIGCSHNRCTYCNMYRTVAFRVRPMPEIVRQIEQAKYYQAHIRRVFLADGNALVLSTDKLLQILNRLTEQFPHLERVSCYASPKDILNKTVEELQQLAAAGLTLLYYGMESGDDEVLQQVCKGVTAQESIEAGKRVVDAGLRLSLMVILGIAGRSRSAQHALHTAQAINAIRPTMLSALTLMLYRGSELLEQYEQGEFDLLSPTEIMEELYAILAQIELPVQQPCLFRSNHVSNYLSFAGNLPEDKQRLLAEVKIAARNLSGLQEWDRYNQVERRF